jgi:hypothetical protein
MEHGKKEKSNIDALQQIGDLGRVWESSNSEKTAQELQICGVPPRSSSI